MSCCAIGRYQTPHAPEPVQTTTAAAAAAVTTRRAQIQIVTAEGDRVTLTASQTSSLAALHRDGPGRAGDRDTFVRRSSQSLSLTVEGNLSREELEDIAKLLEVLRKASTRGAAKHPARLARRLERADLDSLSQVSASFQTTRTVAAAVVTAQPAVPPSPVETEPAPVAA